MFARMSLGDKVGEYEKVAEGEIFDVWKTPGGKYFVFDAITGVSLGKNISSMERALEIGDRHEKQLENKYKETEMINVIDLYESMLKIAKRESEEETTDYIKNPFPQNLGRGQDPLLNNEQYFKYNTKFKHLINMMEILCKIEKEER